MLESPVTVHRVQAIEAQTLCEVSLQMLADAPHAFGDTWASAAAREAGAWQHWAEQLSDHPLRCVVMATDGEGRCGFVIGDGTFAHLPPGGVLVARLWVAARRRGTGLGRRLVDAIAGWAGERGMAQLVAEIVDTNREVVAFYAHLGYRVTGTRAQVLGGVPRQLMVMARDLGCPPSGPNG